MGRRGEGRENNYGESEDVRKQKRDGKKMQRKRGSRDEEDKTGRIGQREDE